MAAATTMIPNEDDSSQNRTRTSSEELFRQTLSPYSELLPTVVTVCQKASLLRSQSLPIYDENYNANSTNTMEQQRQQQQKPQVRRPSLSNNNCYQPSLPFLVEQHCHEDHDFFSFWKQPVLKPKPTKRSSSKVPLYVSHVYPETSTMIQLSRDEYSRCKLPPTTHSPTSVREHHDIEQHQLAWMQGCSATTTKTTQQRPSLEKTDSSRLFGLEFIED
mmetsp:Transcript_5404/g.5984  ORF Transcript_5404/g.5984 Transcript_5404/m.5984 type:complete len:218 (-) Transcript_5404:70-723(-)